MFKKYFSILVLIIFGCDLGLLCHIDVRAPYPLITKSFGSRNITFRAKKYGIDLKEGEFVNLYCGSGINFKTVYYKYSIRREQELKEFQQTKVLVCHDHSIIAFEYHPHSVTAFCASPKLYESQKKLPNCDRYNNYVIGENIPSVRTLIRYGICYDVETLSLNYVKYIAYQEDEIWSSHESTSNELAVDSHYLKSDADNLTNYFDFMSQETFNASRASRMQRTDNTFFQNFDFDFDSILQDQLDDTENKDFGYIFNIMWWRLLRQNNWRFFLDALKERTKSGKYLVYTGTYGNATMPVKDSAGEQLVDLSVHSSKSVVTAPAYIWSYLKSLTPGSEEEFVVIAHNSPYVLAPSHTEFCTNDVCDDIAWLKDSKFGHVRRIPTFGYTFCCRAEEVAKIIEYFPLDTKGFDTTTGAAIELTSTTGAAIELTTSKDILDDTDDSDEYI